MSAKDLTELEGYLHRYGRELAAPMSAEGLAKLEAATDAKTKVELEAAADVVSGVAADVRSECEDITSAVLDITQAFGIKTMLKAATDEERALVLANLAQILDHIAETETELRALVEKVPAAIERLRQAVAKASR